MVNVNNRKFITQRPYMQVLFTATYRNYAFISRSIQHISTETM